MYTRFSLHPPPSPFERYFLVIRWSYVIFPIKISHLHVFLFQYIKQILEINIFYKVTSLHI